MLSRNLQSLFEHLDNYVDTGMELQPEAVYMICAILESAVGDAKELEARSVPIFDQISDLPDNVVKLKRAFQMVGSVVPGGGDAA